MDSEWLKIQFTRNPDKSKAALAQELGLSASAISKFLADGRQIKAHEYVHMCAYFGIKDEGMNLLSEDVASKSLYKLEPLVQGFSEGDLSSADDAWMMPASLLKSKTKAQPEDIKIFSVQESSMEPDFSSGEQVLVDLSDTKPSPPGVFIVSDGLGYIIRNCAYIPNYKPPSIRLYANQSKYDDYTVPLEEAEIVGRVIAKLQWL